MPSDLEIIKELERELGLSRPLPKRRLGGRIPERAGAKNSVTYKGITDTTAYGFFVDDKNNVVGLARIIHKRDYEGKRYNNSTRKHVYKCVYGPGEC